MNEATPYPFPMEMLKRGHNLTQEQCEKVIGKPAIHPTYKLDLLKLRDLVVDESEANNDPLSVVIRGNGLHINTDSEASEYHYNRALAGERAIGVHLRRLRQTVRVAQLTEAEHNEHRRRVGSIAMKRLALLRTKRPWLSGEQEIKQVE